MVKQSSVTTRECAAAVMEAVPHLMRVLRAQVLLERSTMSIEEVAQHCGFRSAAAMRPHFIRQVTTSPSDYKRVFAAR